MLFRKKWLINQLSDRLCVHTHVINMLDKSLIYGVQRISKKECASEGERMKEIELITNVYTVAIKIQLKTNNTNQIT